MFWNRRQFRIKPLIWFSPTPPYNIGKNFNGLRDRWSNQEAYCNWITRWLDLCVKKLKPKGSLYLMCATQCFAQLDIILQKHLTILSRIV